MNRVLLRSIEVPLPAWARAAKSFVLKVLDSQDLKNLEVSILFCSNSYIKSLNAQYRNKDEPTDVLSFPMNEILGKAVSGRGRGRRTGPEPAGDIVISLDALEENVRFFKVSRDEELRRLLVHGILHLSGEDHATNDAEEPMLKTQEKILAALAGERIQEHTP